ncbi:MAG TPA: DUF29 domain-containing protein [Azospirillaceae bacterium]|nr:DUF29 domain-containing protein [Azospirillaceae bacterium]HRQ82505.1 DUF29 domain-containing protein [Azospirillaceae bacterium]
MTTTRYEADFFAWANEQAALLRAGKLSAADIEHIAEEIEDMGRAEQRELENRLKQLLLHLLKWRFQPERRGSSWQASIRIQRVEIAKHVKKNPSLKADIAETMSDAYEVAQIAAAGETGLLETVFPAECPWSYEQIMDAGFWPDAAT